MSTSQNLPRFASAAGRHGPARVASNVLAGLEQLAGGLGTAAVALVLLLWSAAVAVLCLVGVGLIALPVTLRAVRALADRERVRLGRWGAEPASPGPLPTGLRRAVGDLTLRRELGWLVEHATLGLLVGVIGVSLPLYAVREITFPLWWYLLPQGEATDQFALWTVTDWTGACSVAVVFGLSWIAATVALTPGLVRVQAGPGRRLLRAAAGTDLSLRIIQLTATRAAALDAHATELRRIERALHDGTQNRLVAVTMLVGMARRALVRNPSAAEEILDRAQDAAEQALAELRAVARGILPPVLADRGLTGALRGLAANCPIRVLLDVDVPGRCPASVEATTYFMVAEALTNAARHSRAGRVEVVLRRRGDRLHVSVTDDGVGGADEGKGTGLPGIRRRAEAHDGAFRLASPVGGPTTLGVELPCGS